MKSEVTSTVKLLLATLRALKGAKNSKSQLNTFIGYLGNLIQAGTTDTIPANIVKLFEGNIENITSKNVDENIQEIENYLFLYLGHPLINWIFIGVHPPIGFPLSDELLRKSGRVVPL